MSAIGVQSQINKDRALWLSTIPSDVIHGNIICDTIIANAGYISTFYSDNIQVSTLKASSFQVTDGLDVSTINTSSLFTNYAKTSTLQWASDLSGGVGYVNITTDVSGVKVTGDPIKFENLVYFTSTITLVPVSTIVDQDIFAKNGYFSTLSSGSISTSLLNVNQSFISSLSSGYGSFNRLFVSSLEALDISGVDGARYWSQYPTLASSITFQPGFVLSNVNSNLYFAGQELTDVSGGGRDWSQFPAQTDVSMNNFSIRQLSTLQYQDGGRLYSQTGNNLFYNGQPIQFGSASNVSQWANYPAVNTIQTAGFPISSIGNLTLVSNSNIRILADRVSTVADNGIDIGTASRIDMTAQNGYQGVINMTANPGYQGLYGQINMTANGGTVAGVGTGGLISLTANTPLGSACNASSAIKLSAAGINSYAGAIPSVGSLAGYNFIYGQLGVNIVSGLIPSVIPNIPLTTYLYGQAGVTTSSDLYVPNIYPYWNGLTTPNDLFITGRYIVPNLAQVYVQMCNVKHIYMDGAADIQNAKLISTISTIGSVANFNQGQFGSVAAGAVGASAGLFTTLEAGSVSTSSVRAPLLSTININLSTINGINFQEVVQSSNIVASNVTATISVNTAVVNANSTIQTTSLTNFAQVSSFFMGFGLILSTTIGDLRFNNAKVADDITGVTNAPMPLQSRIINFSSINSFNMSTTDLWVSSINGVAPGGGGGSVTNTFSTLFTSSLRVSTLVGYSYPGNSLSTVFVEGGFQFSGDYQGQAFSGRFLSSLRNINSAGEDLNIVGGGLGKEFSITYPGGLPASNSYVRIGGGGAFDTRIFDFGGAGAISTGHVFTSSIIGNPVAGLDISGNVEITGGLFVNDTIEIPLATGGINFDDGSGINYTRMMRRDVAANNMLSVVNTPALGSNNMEQLGVGELWVTGGADQYSALRIYNVFPYDNFGMDIVDENGTTLFEAFACGQVPGGFLTEIAGVSSITGFNHIGGSGNAVGFDNIITAPTTSTQNLLVSTINGLPYGGGGGGTGSFSNLFTSSFFFSTATSVGSNTLFNYPILIDYDQGGNPNAGVAIAVQGHSYGTGFVVNRIEMGARGNGQNYILSSWPGQNLEDLAIDATEVIFNDGNFSTIVNSDPYGLITNGAISAPQLLVSSINGNTAVFNHFVSTPSVLVSSLNDVVSVDNTTLYAPTIGNLQTVNGKPYYVYAEFITTQTINLIGANTVTQASFDTLTVGNGFTLFGGSIQVTYAGLYRLTMSIQFDKSGGGTSPVDWWILQNNNDIPNTGSQITIQGNTGQTVGTCSYYINCAGGDYLTLVFASPDASAVMAYFPAQTSPYQRPAIPAVIANIELIR